VARDTSLRNAPTWKKVLAAGAKREREARYTRQALRYDVDVAAAQQGATAFVVRVRAVYGEGAGQFFAAPHLSRPFAGHFSAEDAPLLALLDGARERNPATPSYASVEPTFVVPLRMAAPVFERLTATGRAHLALANGETDRTAPALAWDDGDDYVLTLQAQMNEPGVMSIAPVLERAQERLAIEAPLLLLDGVLVFRERVATYDDAGQPEWAHAARAKQNLRMWETDLAPMLEEMHTLERAPRVDLPAERAFARVAMTPRPYAILRTRAARGVTVEVGLDYEGHRVHAHDFGHALVDRVGRRIIVRDEPAEWRAVAVMEARGATPASGHFRIAKRELLETAQALLKLGWRVEVDGRLHRRATSFSLSVATGIDWLDVAVRADFDGTPLALPEMLSAIRQQRRTVALADGSVGEIPEEWVERLVRWSALSEPTRDTLRFTKAQAGFVAALAEGDAETVLDAAFDRARQELKAFDGVEPVDPPPSFHGTLRDYQRRALGWFAYLRRFGFGGCLADDMGLGKTVQVLALLEARRVEAREERRPSLVIAPRSVLFNWASEAARFAPELRVHVHDGANRDADRAAEYDVVLTTYGLLRRDAAALARVPFDYLVLDEAQAIKTTRSAAAKAARSLVASHRLALTGTPIENHLGELASLLEFLNPGVLGATPSLAQLAPGARSLDEETRDLLARGVRPFFLRRTKQQVAPELPARVEQTIYCELAPEHRRHYDELRDHYRVSLARRIEREGWGKSTVQVLEALLRLRQLACHPGLVDRSRREEGSAKLEALLEHLASARAEGHKALVFSQFTSLLSIVRARLDADGIAYEYLDGATKDRAARVERFQSDAACSVFLLSLKAGGVGLNLPAADYVFLLDPWWNPASEAQAIDRAHRIGQTRTVFAYRLLARGTIEEKVEALQREKRALSDAFFGERGAALAGITREDLEALLE
jgi:superfamily II DNA or RNA helicase